MDLGYYWGAFVASLCSLIFFISPTSVKGDPCAEGCRTLSLPGGTAGTSLCSGRWDGPGGTGMDIPPQSDVSK